MFAFPPFPCRATEPAQASMLLETHAASALLLLPNLADALMHGASVQLLY